MGDQSVTVPTSQPLDLHTLRSRISELRGIHVNSDDVAELSPSEAENLLKDCALQLQSKISQIISEFSDTSSLSAENLDEYLEHLKRELNLVEAENVQISEEIGELSRRCVENSNQLESNLEALNCSLALIETQGLQKAKGDTHVGYSSKGGEDRLNFLNADKDNKFKILELNNQIEKNEITLKSLQDLDCILKRFEAIAKVEDVLTGVRIIELEGNCIRLSLRTSVQNLESLLFEQKIEDIIEPLEQNHELLIEVVDGTMELKNVDIFPNDVYIGEIIDAAKSFRQLFSPVPLLETRSYLEWLVRRVQDKIVLCTLRRFVVKCANKSRHSLEYLDKDEIIIAHIMGGVDAFIKVLQGWPVSSCALKLKSLKGSINYSNEFSSSFLCKVEEMANSLDAHVRQNILSFVDAIEEIIVRQTLAELQSDNKDKGLLEI